MNGRRPRLLLVLTEFPPRIGGMQTHALYLARHLAARGYPLIVVTYQPATLEERCAVAELDRTLPFAVMRRLSRLGYWHNIDELTRIGRRFGAELVYCSTVFYGFLRASLGVPVICRSVGNDVMRPWIAYPFRPGSHLLALPYLDDRLYRFFRNLDYPELVEALFRRQRCRLVRESVRQIDLVLANSTFTAGLLQQIGVPEARLEIVVGGVDAARFAPRARASFDRAAARRALGVPEQAYVLVTACRLVAKKGIDFLLPAFARLIELMPDAHLVIVGSGRHGRRYRRLARRFGLEQRVTFAGRVEHQRIQDYYWLSDLFVLASRVQVDPATGLRDAETMGRVLCEANAAAVPTLAARSGGIPSVIADGKNGLLFEPDDERDFLRQAIRARYDTAVVTRMVRRGQIVARRRFDWHRVLTAHERSFARVLEGRTFHRSDADRLGNSPRRPRVGPRVDSTSSGVVSRDFPLTGADR